MHVLQAYTAIGSSGKTIKSGPEDRVFVYFADHGAPGRLLAVCLALVGLAAHGLPAVLQASHAIPPALGPSHSTHATEARSCTPSHSCVTAPHSCGGDQTRRFQDIWASHLCGLGQRLLCLRCRQCRPGPRCMHEEQHASRELV